MIGGNDGLIIVLNRRSRDRAGRIFIDGGACDSVAERRMSGMRVAHYRSRWHDIILIVWVPRKNQFRVM